MPTFRFESVIVGFMLFCVFSGGLGPRLYEADPNSALGVDPIPF